MVGSVALRMRGYHNVLSNFMGLLLLCISGVNFPLAILPDWAQALAHLFPLTHGLLAIRLMIDGASPLPVLLYVGLELGVGLLYILLAQQLFHRLLRRARVLGTLELY